MIGARLEQKLVGLIRLSSWAVRKGRRTERLRWGACWTGAERRVSSPTELEDNVKVSLHPHDTLLLGSPTISIYIRANNIEVLSVLNTR